MKPVAVPILFNNDNTSRLEELGLDFELDNCDVRTATFYNIDAILPRTDNRCTIVSGGEVYICNIHYDKIIEIINKFQ